MTPWTHEFSCVLPRPPARVFAALIEPLQLERWWAEHAEVEPRAGGAYRFWGRHTYATPDRSEARQKLTRVEPNRVVAYSWRLLGLDSMVTLELAPESAEGVEAAKLTIRHEFPRLPEGARADDLVDDLWRLACGNLRAHLLGLGGLLWPDYGNPRPEVRLSVLIDAPRANVFKALIDPVWLNRWIASAAVVEPRAGGRYSYGWNYAIKGRDVQGGPTRILELVENERLVTDWPDWRGDPSVAPTTVAWLLMDEGTGTRVTLVHGPFARSTDVSDYPFGWQDFLAQLKAKLEDPTGD